MTTTSVAKTTENIINRLPNFYLKNSYSNNYKFIYSIAEEFYNLKMQTIGLKQATQIDTATETDLNRIGQLFKLTRRTAETDNQFRIRIKSYWQSYIGSGVGNSIKQLVANIINGDVNDIDITQDESLIFDLVIYIDENTDIELFGYIRDEVNKIKALGMYFNQLLVESKDNLFLINLSEINGENEIL